MPTNPNSDLLLITCASGKQASALLPLLTEWKNLRLAVNSSSSKQRLKQQCPHADVVQTDIYDPTNTITLLKDVNVVIHIGPSYHAHEAEIGYMMIDAAVTSYDSGQGPLRHFILSSVLHSQLSKMINHNDKKLVEEYIIESGLPYTTLQPTTFMDNLPIGMLMQQPSPIFSSAWSLDSRFSWIALHDLAEAMHVVLAQRESHFHASYPLVSTHGTVSFREGLEIIGEKMGKEIKVEQREFKDAVNTTLVRLFGKSEGVDRRTRDTAERMIIFYDGRGLVGNSNVLEWVIGRKATQFEDWAERKVKECGKK